MADELVSGLMVLTPSESKRLIAKAVVQLPEVQNAFKKGRIIIANGTTNAFVVEELLGIKIAKKAAYTRGHIIDGAFASNRRSPELIRSYAIVDGKPVDTMPADVLQEFTGDDVFIKGANAVDMEGNIGILMGGRLGGTIGSALAIVTSTGSHLICPVGLEKLVPSVLEAAQICGIDRLKYPKGVTLGLMPVTTALTITEIEALFILAGVEATHVASGGIGGSEGSVALVVEGSEEEVAKAFEIVGGVKGEPAVSHPGEMSSKYTEKNPTGSRT